MHLEDYIEKGRRTKRTTFATLPFKQNTVRGMLKSQLSHKSLIKVPTIVENIQVSGLAGAGEAGGREDGNVHCNTVGGII